MEIMECSFCKELETTKEHNRRLSNSMRRFGKALAVHYKVVLVEHQETHELDGFKQVGKVLSKTTYPHAERYIHYCPVCGKKL